MPRSAYIACCVILQLALSSAHADDFDDAFTAYNSCYLEQLELYASSCEPADFIAIAVVRGCPVELDKIRSQTIRIWGPERATEYEERLLEIRKEQAIASIMKRRLEHPCN